MNIFKVQISNPKINNVFNPEDTNLEEAIESIFPLENEYAFIIWDNIFIPLSYKYDVSTIINDVITLVDELETNINGEIEIHWASNNFAAVWEISYNKDIVWLSSKWNDVLGKGIKETLNVNSNIQVDKHSFIEQWKLLLSTVCFSLVKCGYNNSNLIDFRMLDEIVSNKPI